MFLLLGNIKGLIYERSRGKDVWRPFQLGLGGTNHAQDEWLAQTAQILWTSWRFLLTHKSRMGSGVGMDLWMAQIAHDVRVHAQSAQSDDKTRGR